ncbi:MAG: zf-HC2 domain-containing protein [Armatimonadota bacterium]|nr:MAG: zf-HC2 domain-containing protein [Armatimonadota bacterium]
MRCHDAIELFTQYRDGDLDAATRSALEAHLAACARCRDEFAALDAICASLRAVPTEPVPAEFVSGVRARLQAPAERPRAVLLRWALPAGAAAVLVVVAFGVFSIVPRTGGVRAPAATDRAKGPVEALRAGDDLRLDAGPARRGGGREEQGRPPSGGPDDSVAGTAGVKAPSSAPADQAQRATRERVDRAAADREDYSTLKAPVAAGRVTAPEEPPPAPPPPAAIAEKPVRDAPAVLRIGERVIRPETPSKLRAAPEAPGAEQPSAATPDVPEDSTPPAPDRSGFFERARAASLNLSAQATRTQRAAGNLTLQLETEE